MWHMSTLPPMDKKNHIGWRSKFNIEVSHSYYSTNYARIAISACGQIDGVENLQETSVKPHCAQCEMLEKMTAPDQRNIIPGGK